MDESRAIYGIDFSGAKDAGNKIWIAKGVPDGKRLLVSECYSASEHTNLRKGIEDCLPALVNLVKSETSAAFGFDFPFGLPSSLVQKRAKTWEDFVLEFPTRYKSAEAFREACRQTDRGSELKRQTDIEALTPFSPYNLWIYKQTYYGISEVLRPFVRNGHACILPFQEPVAGKPWILEVCPASTLKRLMKVGVPSYKGSEEDKRENRREILGVVMKEGVAFVKDAGLEEKIIANKGGDALDSVIAALAVFRALRLQHVPPGGDKSSYAIEGYVFAG